MQYRNREGTQNELDVLFTRDNKLHLVECKSLDADEGEEGGAVNLPSFLYKLGALRQEFGLTPLGYLATTSEAVVDNEGRLKESLRKRAKQLYIDIVPLILEKPQDWFRRKFRND